MKELKLLKLFSSCLKKIYTFGMIHPALFLNSVSLEGFEPPTTVPKTVVISISPQGQKVRGKNLNDTCPAPSFVPMCGCIILRGRLYFIKIIVLRQAQDNRSTELTTRSPELIERIEKNKLLN